MTSATLLSTARVRSPASGVVGSVVVNGSAICYDLLPNRAGFGEVTRAAGGLSAFVAAPTILRRRPFTSSHACLAYAYPTTPCLAPPAPPSLAMLVQATPCRAVPALPRRTMLRLANPCLRLRDYPCRASSCHAPP